MKKYYLFLLVLIGVATSFSCSNSSQTDTESVSKISADMIQVHVSGMTCEGCENTVERALTQEDGVVSADASAKDSVVVVKLKRNKTSFKEIKAAIEYKGYEVKGYNVIEE
ncbi:MAG: cation transporter [Hyphomicrobiales bacterium]